MNNVNTNIRQWLTNKAKDPAMHEWAAEFLTSLCAVDTSITSDIERLRTVEKQCFDLCAQQLNSFLEKCTIQMLPIDAALIRKDPDYTIPYYAGPLKDNPEKVYHGRFNMLAAIGEDPRKNADGGADDGNAGYDNRWILNAHIDTVAPHIAPSKINDMVLHGRGTVDNKGGVVCAVMVARLLHDAARERLIKSLPLLDLVFVSDEESGGNGALSAINHLSPTNGLVVVLEPTGLTPHPANRGALWFKLALTAEDENVRDLLLMAVFNAVRAITDAGMDIKSQSRHPLFSKDDVQTCFGILGSYGKHPSSACTDLEIQAETKNGALNEPGLRNSMTSAFDAALSDGEFTHKTEYPCVEAGGGKKARLHFRSIGGHMGSMARDSDAIVKAASTTIRMAQKKELFFHLLDKPRTLILEGGQGFLPDHTIEDVKEKIALAVESALHDFRSMHGLSNTHLHLALSFDKLHNRAYCSKRANGTEKLVDALYQLTEIDARPLQGWQASCDARIFAKKFKEVITFGAGRLQDAHQDDEQIHLPDIAAAAAVITLAIMTSKNAF